MTCPVCSAAETREFLVRESVPVHQNLVMATAEAAASIARGRLAMRICPSCGFAFNAAFDAGLLAYGDDYDNTQSHSPSFRAYLDELVAHLVTTRGVQDARIVEVGCGKGYFLREVVAAHPGNRGWGFDPSYLGPEVDLDGRLQFRRELYGPAHESVTADVVICRHVIEHVADPVALLRSVRAALASSPRARVVFETPCLEWILRGLVSWDLFYEHCSLFTAASLRTAFERAGFAVESVKHIFGGQYLWLEARLAPAPTDAPTREPGEVVALADAFAGDEQRWRAMWTERLRGGDRVAVWGAGAKGVTFTNLVDPTRALIDCVVDLNPRKQGQFLPGTGHPIIAPGDLATRSVRRAVLMNPNYRAENERLLAELGLTVALED